MMESSARSLPVLSAGEVRILGCLVEKELTTPDNYPLTLNSLLAACNQKTSRDPVMSLDAVAVEEGLRSLKERGFVREVSGAEHRVPKFKHDMPFMLRLNHAQTAVLTVLMLRGAQTAGELRGRTERMYSFDSLDDVASTLDSLRDLNGRRLVMELERQPGTKEPRYTHLLAGEEAAASLRVAAITGGESAERRDEIAELREEIAEVREELATLRTEFAKFREQFD